MASLVVGSVLRALPSGLFFAPSKAQTMSTVTRANDPWLTELLYWTATFVVAAAVVMVVVIFSGATRA